MSEDVQNRIRAIVTGYPVVLFMKGTPDAPQCGFSSRVSMLMKDCGKPFASFDVLTDSNIRDGIKVFANWPTIPQLYVQGEFVGGSDIVGDMHTNGELLPLLEKATSA